MANPTAPNTAMVIAAGTGARAVKTKAASTSASRARITYRLGISARSATFPPIRLPAHRPTPNRTSSQATAPEEKPATSVIIGAR